MSNIVYKGKMEEKHENQTPPDEGKAKHPQAQLKNKNGQLLKQKGTSFVYQ